MQEKSALYCVLHRIHIICYVLCIHLHVLSVYFTGPGGEDLEGGYYDAGDNLKVEYDV